MKLTGGKTDHCDKLIRAPPGEDDGERIEADKESKGKSP
jgi:hypothetical protein